MPKVTAGFTCPPETFAAIYTDDDRAKVFAMATNTRLDGSVAASDINFPGKQQSFLSILKNRRKKKETIKSTNVKPWQNQ